MAHTDDWKWWVAGGVGVLVVGGGLYWWLGRETTSPSKPSATGAPGLSQGALTAMPTAAQQAGTARAAIQPGRVVLGEASPVGATLTSGGALEARVLDMTDAALIAEFQQDIRADRRQAIRNELQWRGYEVQRDA